MKSSAILIVTVLAASILAGCFGGSAGDDFDYEPGKGFTETGKIVRIKMWVVDLVDTPIYPGLSANLWAFCAAPSNPEDTYSANAIEYWEEGKECSVPAPTLRIKQGDRLIVNFENDHFHPHTVHWHGQHVPMSSDGVPGVTQDSVAQGGSFTYDYIAKRAGTLWFHCHVDVQFHVMMGLYGMIIVEPQDTRWEPKNIDKEFNIIMSTAQRAHIEYIPPLPGETVDPHANHKGDVCGKATGMQGCQNPSVDVTPDIFMMNGKSFPSTLKDPKSLLTLEPGERVRIRMLNAGEELETWHWHGHDVYVTHKDGNPLPPSARFWTETLAIGPAERYDVVIEGSAEQAGNWVMHTHVENHVQNDGQAPGGMLTMITYPGFEDDLAPFKAELAGGQGFVRPRVVPEDHRIEWGRNFAANNEISLELAQLPTEDLCLVEDVYLGFHLYGSALALRTSELTLSIRDAANTKIDFPLGGDGGAVAGNWNPLFADLVAGVYKVSVTGTASDVQLHVSGLVDYFPSEDDAVEAGRPCKAGDDHADDGGHTH